MKTLYCINRAFRVCSVGTVRYKFWKKSGEYFPTCNVENAIHADLLCEKKGIVDKLPANLDRNRKPEGDLEQRIAALEIKKSNLSGWEKGQVTRVINELIEELEAKKKGKKDDNKRTDKRSSDEPV